MPDISMCDNRSCTIREHCFRFRAVPGRMQSWSRFENDGRCYMPVYFGRAVRTMEECEG